MDRIEPQEYAIVRRPDGFERGQRTGGYRHCQLEGCSGIRIGIRWPDGQVTWPCTKGLIFLGNGEWQML
jgi:hypothetical protein